MSRQQSKRFTLKELADLTGARIIGDPQYVITGIADLATATSEQISFLAATRYKTHLAHSKAGVIIIDEKDEADPNKNWLVATNPSLAFQKIIDSFYEEQINERTSFKGIHKTAVIHPEATVAPTATIGPHVTIEKNAVIGDHSILQANSYIGIGVTIGHGCLLYPNVVVREYCQIGNRVIIQPGAIIGSCGFGYITNNKGKHEKLNQVGIVILEDDVEIGANTTIDRARHAATVISKGTKIDNLVQIAHNVSLGEDNIIVAQTGIAGSTSTGKLVIMGGQVAVDGHLYLTDGVMLSARSGVSKSLRQAGKYGGTPCFNLEEYNRNSVYLRHIDKYVERIKELEKRLEKLEKSE